MNNARYISISMGGNTLEIDRIIMHSSNAVSKWQGLMASAHSMLGGFSTGIGVWGSPGVALAGAAAIGFLEAAVTNANQKKGFQLLAEAFALGERLRPRGMAMEVSQITGVDRSNPERWRARGEVLSELDIRVIGMFERNRLKKEYHASDDEISTGFIVRRTVQDLVFFPDDFVTCVCGDNIVLVKWCKVDTYRVMY